MLQLRLRKIRSAALAAVATLSLLAMASGSQAGTIVRVSTTVGDFSIDLLDNDAPRTVENFLNYVNRNAYNGNYIHRAVDNFVVQTGGYRFQPFVGPVDVPTDPPVANEFGASNLRGTVAMAKLEGQPDSATSQWFVNLNDNVSLDSNSGGFTVFGRVLGEGMQILEEIDDLRTVSLGFKAPSAPHASGVYTDPSDFVYTNVEITRRFSAAPHLLELATGLLITSVDIDEGDDFISLNMNVVEGVEPLTLEVNAESIIPRREFEGMATYSTSDNRLRIPTLEVNLGPGQVILVNDVVFARSLSDPPRLVLESFAQ